MLCLRVLVTILKLLKIGHRINLHFLSIPTTEVKRDDVRPSEVSYSPT